MASALIQGTVDVYETTDGGTGDPRQTIWQFFVAGIAVNTRNPDLAQTMVFAASTANVVQVSYESTTGIIFQARMEIMYRCEKRKNEACRATDSPEVCERNRYSLCENRDGRPLQAKSSKKRR